MDGYLGEIRIFSGGLLPADWSYCDGRILSGPSYPGLYAILLNRFGGEPAAQTFALPRLADPLPGTHYIICIDGVSPIPDSDQGGTAHVGLLPR